MNFKAINRQILRSIVLIFGIAFFLTLGFFLILHYVNIKKGFLNLGISKGYISLSKVDYKFFKHGSLAYEIFSKSLSYSSPAKHIIRLKDVRVYIYGKNKKYIYIITGKDGRLNADSKDIMVSGDVAIKGAGGLRVSAKSIYYFAKDDKIITPGYVKIKGNGYHISGSGLLLYVKQRIFILHRDVRFISEGRG